MSFNAPDTPDATGTPSPRRSRWGRRLAGIALLLGFLCGCVVWLNIQGGALLVRHILLYEASKVGLTGHCTVKGTLLHGLMLQDVDLRGTGPLRAVRIDRLTLAWDLRELHGGRLQGLTANNAQLVYDLSSTPLSTRATKRSVAPPSTPWPRIHELWRHYLSPVAIDLRDIRIELLRSDAPFLTLASTDIFHPSGSDSITFRLGQLMGPSTDDQRLAIPEQHTTIHVGCNALSLDLLTLPGGIVLGPVHANPQTRNLTGDITQGGARFHAQWDTTEHSAILAMDNGSWDAISALRPWGIAPPATQLILTRLQARLHRLDRPSAAWSAKVDAALASFSWQQWQAQDLSVTATTDEAAFHTRIEGCAQGSRIQATAHWARTPGAPIDVRFASPAIDAAFAAVRQRYFPGAEAPLRAALAAEATLTVNDRSVTGILAKANLRGIIAGTTEIPAATCTFDWPDFASAMHTTLTIEGIDGSAPLDASASIDMDRDIYKAALDIPPAWPIDLFRHLGTTVLPIPMPTLPAGGLQWSGDGNWRHAHHRGKLALSIPSIGTGPRPKASLKLSGSYNWPQRITLDELHLHDENLLLTMKLAWEDNILRAEAISLAEHDDVLLHGSCMLPLSPAVRDLDAVLAQPGAIQASLSVPARPLAFWQERLAPTRSLPLQGRAEFTIDVSGSFSAPVVTGKLHTTALRLDAFPSLPPAELSATLGTTEERRLQLAACLRQPDIEPIDIIISAPFAPLDLLSSPDAWNSLPLKGSLHMKNLQLQRYATIVSSLKSLTGTLDASVSLSGTPSVPDIRGTLQLSDASLVPLSPHLGHLDNAALTIDFSGRSARITRGVATLGGGALKLDGMLDFSNPARPGIDLRLGGDHLLLWRDNDLLVRASPSLRFSGGLEAWRIDGSIAVAESLFFRDFEILPIGRAFTVPAAPSLPKFDPPKPPRPAPWMDTVALDVRVHTADPLLVRGNLARGNITADVKAGGTLARPTLEGAANLHEVVARLPFSTLKITRGQARFLPEHGMTPQLSVLGESSLPPYTVSIAVSGLANQPQIDLSSEPPLPQNEILALLASGSTTAALTDTTNAQGKAIQLLLAALRRGDLPLGRRIGDLLAPLDNIQVQVGQDSPYDGRRRNGASIQLNDRLLLSGSIDAFNHERLTLTLLFRFQ